MRFLESLLQRRYSSPCCSMQIYLKKSLKRLIVRGFRPSPEQGNKEQTRGSSSSSRVSDKSETHTHTHTVTSDGGSGTTRLLAEVEDEHTAIGGRGADLIPSGVPADLKDATRTFVTVHQLAGLKQARQKRAEQRWATGTCSYANLTGQMTYFLSFRDSKGWNIRNMHTYRHSNFLLW